MHHPPSSVLALAAAMLLAAIVPAGAASDRVAALAGSRRVLLVAAAAPDDGDLRRQRDVFAAMAAGAAERDLVLVEAVGPSAAAAALRERFAIPSDRFAAVLIGKDGTVKLRSATVLGPDRLFPTIDAMPMRQDEMRRRLPKR